MPHTRIRWGLSFGVLLGAFLAASAAWALSDAKTDAFRYNAKGRRDPFVPLVRDGQFVTVSQQGPSPLETSRPMLRGILWDPGGHSLALINDIEAKVGHTIGDYQVREIRHDAVVLSNGAGELVLEISFEAPPSSATTGGEGR